MKSGLLLLLLPALTLQAQQVTWLTPTTIDLGSVKKGATATTTFRFTNPGAEPLIIDVIRTTCGCTAAQWPQEPILPGKAADIRIEFHADNLGYFRRQIKVYFHGQRLAEKLYIEGLVEKGP